MKVLKYIPEAGVAVVLLDDGTQLTVTGKDLKHVEQIATKADTKKKADKAENEAAKAQEKADKEMDKLAKKADKALPDILAHLRAVKYAASVPYYEELKKAIEGLV